MRIVVGIRALDTPDEVSRFNLETGWHWFARQYKDGRFSPAWYTTRDAARRGLSSAGPATLWGWDETEKRWVRDSLVRAGRVIAGGSLVTQVRRGSMLSGRRVQWSKGERPAL